MVRSLPIFFSLHLFIAAFIALAENPQAASRDEAEIQSGLMPRLTATTPRVVLQEIARGLDMPVAITHAGDASRRLFITLQRGSVVIWDGASVLPTPFLNINDLVSCCGERGLLSVAFHPGYENNGFLFVNYTNNNGDTVIARYSVSSSNANLVDPSSARILLTIGQPFANHNGGQIKFGPDGYLYIGMGDGGSGGDPGNRSQNLSTLLGKMLRVDIDRGDPYAIPPDNPFIGRTDARAEIWALGLRNPWRFTFDRNTGDMFIGDVGQNAFEEIDFQPAQAPGGINYGWRKMEGAHCFNPATNCFDSSLTLPVLEYGRSEGCSVTGGYRYRGRRFQRLAGLYLYGDFCSGIIWGALEQAGGRFDPEVLLDTSLAISTFGEDGEGELYVADHGGRIFLITETTPQRRRPVRR